jgi:hypothetical protein
MCPSPESFFLKVPKVTSTMTFERRRLIACGLTAVLGILTVYSTIDAQSLARPAITMRRHPTMQESVWPADFNRDGLIDFVTGEGWPPFNRDGMNRVVVRLGNGGGGIGLPIPTGVHGEPATIGDFDGDGRIDVVVTQRGNSPLWILPGLGTGRFAPARSLGTVEDFRFATSADINRDGRLDLVLGHGTTVEVQPGNGDFTFGPSMVLSPATDEEGVSAAIAVDLNRDRRLDLVVAQRRRSILVYVNGGGLLFTASEIVIEEFEEPDQIHGLASADLNRDGIPDLIVPHAQDIIGPERGGVDVLLGRGNGTFRSAVRYHTGVNGPRTATTGDFNRDGHIDVAIGGNSFGRDDLSDIRSYWDSVAIFPGRSNGTLGDAAVFRLDTAAPRFTPADPTWVDRHHALRTADVNRDGHDDLVASPGALLLNRVDTPNRPPTADAGPDLVADGRGLIVGVRMTEPDWDWLRVEWRNERGVVIRTAPSFEFGTVEDTTLTVTVTDARGATATDTVVVRRSPPNPAFVDVIAPAPGQRYPAGSSIVIRWDASSDQPIHHFEIDISSDNFQSVVNTLHRDVPGAEREFTWGNAGPPGTEWRVRIWAVDAEGRVLSEDISESFRIDQTSAGPFPWPWEEHGDVGAVGAAGSASYANGAFTVRGAGADIGGTADEFHFVSGRIMEGNFAFTARVAAIENVDSWTKVGLMIREDLSPGSRHWSVFVTPTTLRGTAFQRRVTTNGESSHTPGPAIAGPAWLKIIRFLGVIRAFARKNAADPWTLIGEQESFGLPARLHLLMVVSSHVDARLATARFDTVTFDPLEFVSSSDIGATREGHTETDGVNIRIDAAGTDIAGRSDSFRYHNSLTPGSANASITVRLRSLEHTHPLAKAGVMIRSEHEPGSPHVMLVATPSNGIRLQYRKALDGESFVFAQRAGTAPVWLRLTRVGNVFTGLTSADGVTWTRVGAVSIPMRERTLIGLAVTSHAPDTFATAVFDELVIR